MQLSRLFGFLAVLCIPFSAIAHDEKGESFKLSGTISSIELSETGGVINVSANAGRYGKVYLTYNVKLNPSVPNQGYFHGRGVGINDEGERNAGPGREFLEEMVPRCTSIH